MLKVLFYHPILIDESVGVKTYRFVHYGEYVNIPNNTKVGVFKDRYGNVIGYSNSII